jgi:PAS domain S-box-containing protein
MLSLINSKNQMQELMKLVAVFLRDWSGCEAVGIRLQEGEDFPYFETSGFPEEFVLAESKLCSLNELGEPIRDSRGRVYLECMCGNIISSRFDPSRPFFTKHGSFWTNSTTDLLASTTNADRLAKTRNRCNTAGYESVALVPLRAGGQTFGLLQFNSKQRGGFTPEKISLLERLADNLAIGLAQRRADNALRESEDKFKTLADESFDSIVIHDGQRIIEVNKAFGRLWGYDPKEAAGLKIYEFFAPECWEDINRKVQSGYDRPYETVAIRKDGARFTVEIVGRSIIYKGRKVRIATTRDITERKQAEEALKKSNQLLRDTGEMAKVGGWELDLSTKEVFCTEETCRIHGLEPGHKISLEEALNFYAPESRPALEAVLKKAAETGEPYDIESLFIPSGSKDKIWVRSLGRAVYSGGKIVKLAGTFQNIDKYKRAEERLQEERNLLRTLIDHIPDGVYVKDKDSRFIICNKAVAGYWEAESKGNLIGKTDFDLFEPARAQVFFDEEKKLMQTGQLLTNLDRQITDKAGNIHYGLTTKAPLKDSRGNVTGLVGINRDITEHKKAEQRLLEYQKRLKRLAAQLTLAEERERRRIAGELHDNVSQSLALAKIKLDSLHAAVASEPLAKIVEDVSTTLAKAIQDTRSLTFDLSNPILYELGFEAAVAEWLNEQLLDKHGIATEFQDDGKAKPLDDDVRVLLFRNVRELLINVIKHANAGKVRVSIRRINDSIEVVVEDNGVGFDTAEVRSLSGKRAEFGLFSIRESLEEIGGRFEIESKPDAGCTATMTAPLKGQPRKKEE